MLLSSRPLFSATSSDELAGRLEQHYGARLSHAGGDDETFIACANVVKLGRVTLHYCRYDAEVRIEFPPLPGLRQFVALSGAGKLGTTKGDLISKRGHLPTLQSGRGFIADYGAGYSHIVVQYDEPALASAIESITDTTVSTTQLEAMSFDVEPDVWSGLNPIAMALCAQFQRNITPNHTVSERLESALVVSFASYIADRHLGETKHPHEKVDANLFAEYVLANIKRPVGVEELARTFNLSIRTVFDRIKHRHGVSPAAFIRNLRLDEARRQLLAGECATVTEVALRCGFEGLGHFSNRYRERFGELPSSTLVRRPILNDRGHSGER